MSSPDIRFLQGAAARQAFQTPGDLVTLLHEGFISVANGADNPDRLQALAANALAAHRCLHSASGSDKSRG
ncbi:MAG TPA: hypothetical protein PKE27_17935 [Povalibacter sp.]|uniref:hypothetical protein n=1 Tax=Povalibacter sp. TaxID=1962978 RepID=UPI002D09F018|nr:hypothetical protein [Povalibacter sp.]HMN46461.1 hypothetical protein [Povalibacter sp.]